MRALNLAFLSFTISEPIERKMVFIYLGHLHLLWKLIVWVILYLLSGHFSSFIFFKTLYFCIGHFINLHFKCFLLSVLCTFQILILYQINGWQRFSTILLTNWLIKCLQRTWFLVDAIPFFSLAIHSWTIRVLFRTALNMPRPLSDIPIFTSNVKASGLG